MSRPAIYFDDIAAGDVFTFGPYEVERGEMLAFSRKWDPLPIHVDDGAARERGHREITASGQYTLCVKQALLNRAPWSDAVIGAMGFDELRFPQPVYPGDRLSLTIECTDTRASRSKPDRGIVKFTFEVTNQHGETVLSYLDTVMFARRAQSPAAAPDTPATAPAPQVETSAALPLATTLLMMKRNGVDEVARVTHISNQLRLKKGEAQRIHRDFEAGIAAGFRIAMGMPPATDYAPGDEAFHAIASQLGVQDVQAMIDAELQNKARKKRRNTLIVAGLCLAAVGALIAMFLLN